MIALRSVVLDVCTYELEELLQFTSEWTQCTKVTVVVVFYVLGSCIILIVSIFDAAYFELVK